LSEQAIMKILSKFIPPLAREQARDIMKDIADYYEHAKAVEAAKSPRGK